MKIIYWKEIWIQQWFTWIQYIRFAAVLVISTIWFLVDIVVSYYCLILRIFLAAARQSLSHLLSMLLLLKNWNWNLRFVNLYKTFYYQYTVNYCLFCLDWYLSILLDFLVYCCIPGCSMSLNLNWLIELSVRSKSVLVYSDRTPNSRWTVYRSNHQKFLHVQNIHDTTFF
jgi:hypothetical protein